MRTIVDHIVPGDLAANNLVIEVTDEPGAGGANHRYEISGYDGSTNEACKNLQNWARIAVFFQNGPINEVGVNGITQEALLAIVLDRLRCFQAGPFACDENEMALGHVAQALDHLQERTRRRIARGVEGKSIV